MAHTPNTPETGPKDQATIIRFLVSYTTENLTEEQRSKLTRAFTSFQENVVREAPASSTEESKEDLS